MRKLLVFTLFLAACTTAGLQIGKTRKIAGNGPEDTPRVFQTAREILKRSLLTSKDRVLKAFAESRVVELLQREPVLIDATRDQLIRAIESRRTFRPLEGETTMSNQILFIQGGGEGTHDAWDNKLVDSLEQLIGL